VQQLGKYLLIIGLLLAVIGGLMWLLGNKLHWFGNLPGDIRVERENFSFYFPITTMILLSLIISVLLWFFRRFF
jgi:H+/Cl- antiporter ClcA